MTRRLISCYKPEFLLIYPQRMKIKTNLYDYAENNGDLLAIRHEALCNCAQ